MAYTDIDKPSDYFNTKLYTGNGSSGHAITGVGFQPDLVWIKPRDQAYNHRLFDVVRGAGKKISSDTNSAEATDTNEQTSFNSDGFTIGSDAGTNANTKTYASWNWKAGTSVSGDTTGSGTLKTYTGSVNTTSGFSIIKYTGNGTAGHTIPHHLGVAPSAIFVKKLNELGDWSNYHSVLGNAGYMRLNNTNAFATASTYWNNTSPTSSVFTTGTTGNINGSGSTYIAICFADVQGYSKIGSYIGNGNADGTFVYTGFKPAFILRKRTDTTGAWLIQDNKRDGINRAVANSLPTDQNVLRANDSSAEEFNNELDILSNGFKLRATDAFGNASGGTYIFAAFASNPFVTSTGVPACAR